MANIQTIATAIAAGKLVVAPANDWLGGLVPVKSIDEIDQDRLMEVRIESEPVTKFVPVSVTEAGMIAKTKDSNKQLVLTSNLFTAERHSIPAQAVKQAKQFGFDHVIEITNEFAYDAESRTVDYVDSVGKLYTLEGKAVKTK